MTPRNLVKPLESHWQDVLDEVLRRRGAPTTRDVGRLAPKVAALSQAYNSGAAGLTEGVHQPLDARIAFSFVRDVPKGAGAVRELIAARALAMPEGRALRIVDVGAGLGAMTWGIARALAASGGVGRIEALLVDTDEQALVAAKSIAAEARVQAERRGEVGPIELALETRVVRIGPGLRLPEADIVVMGQVLSELDGTLEPAERVARHAALALELLRTTVAPDGALVLVEPALRTRTRHLHAVRDRVVELARDQGDAAIFAPCLQAEPCSALASEGSGNWCHDDLAVDLPSFLEPVARAAGLRWQGLTFSYLVLRRDRMTLASLLPRGPGGDPRVHLRVVSEIIRTKGKAEIFACTEAGSRVRMRRLDRDATGANAAWDALQRGDVVSLTTESAEPPVDERGRVGAHASIDVWAGRK